MAKVTSKFQLTIPKAIATQCGIHPGDQLDLQPAGEGIRMILRNRQKSVLDVRERLRLFDEATNRQLARQAKRRKAKEPTRRGWTRADLYDRGGAR
jgi:AbrB family looped-hinge helix DNA binding protein